MSDSVFLDVFLEDEAIVGESSIHDSIPSMEDLSLPLPLELDWRVDVSIG